MTRTPLLIATVLLLAALPLAPGNQAQNTQDSPLEITTFEVANTTYDAPEPASAFVRVENNGSTSETGTLQLRYNNTERTLTGDYRSEQPTGVLSPGESFNVTVDWSPSEEQIGPGTAIALLDDGDPNTRDERVDRDVFVDEYALNTTLVDTSQHATFPGRWTPYRVDVANVGNAPATVNASLQSISSGDWDVRLPRSIVDLDTGETTRLLALVAPPNQDADELPDGSNASVQIEVETEQNPLANASIALPNTTVDREPEPAFAFGVVGQVDLDVATPVPNGTPATVPLHATNLGNVPDAFNVSVEAEGALAEHLQTEPARDVVGLAPGETVTVPVRVAAATPPSPDLSATVRASVSSVNSEVFEPDAVNETAFDVRVQAPDLEIDDVAVPDAVYRENDRVEVPVRVTNAGGEASQAARVEITVVRGGFPFANASASIPALSPDESATSTVVVPVGNLSGDYELHVRADAGDQVPENREGNNDRVAPVTVRSIQLRVQPATGVEAVPGQLVRYENPPHVFQVVNTGNAREDVVVEVESEHGWIDETQNLEVPAGGRQPVTVSFLVPEQPGTERDRLTVSAHLPNLTSVQTSNATFTSVLDREPPELVDADVPGNVTASTPFRVETTWSDAIGVASVEGTLVSPSDLTSTVTFRRAEQPAGEAGPAQATFVANHTVNELGTYELTLEATDASSEANAFTHEDAFEIEADYDRAPTVRFDHPNERRVVKAGTPIPVNVTADVAVRTVRYDAGGIQGTLGTPFEVPTGDWPEGNRTVTVTAVNRYGLSAGATTNYTVDNTPPSVEDVRLDPSNPQPGQSVTVEVLADDTAVNATAFAAEDAGAERSLPLEPTAGGDEGQSAFQGTATLEPGAYTLRLVVEDAAGNQAQVTREIEIGDNGAPAPGLAGLAGALALALALARRGDRGRPGRR